MKKLIIIVVIIILIVIGYFAFLVWGKFKSLDERLENEKSAAALNPGGVVCRVTCQGDTNF